MSETQEIPSTIPVLRKDAEFTMKINYNDLGAISQAIFLITENWKNHEPQKIEDLKKILQDRGQISDLSHHAFLILDNFYKRCISEAKLQGVTEEIDIKSAFSPL